MKNAHIVLLVYSLVILLSVLYFGFMQHFGFRGMAFEIGGRDRIFSFFDFLILFVTALSIFLLVLSLEAFRRTNDTRLLILSFAFFFFSLVEFLSVLENFFPREFIYINNASKVLELLVLLSFVMLIYSAYKGGKNRGMKTRKRTSRQ